MIPKKTFGLYPVSPYAGPSGYSQDGSRALPFGPDTAQRLLSYFETKRHTKFMNDSISRTTTALPGTATTNRVLRNTYALLGLLFAFGAGTAYIAQAQGWYLGFWMFLISFIGLTFALNATRNSGWGLLVAFAFSGLMGVVSGGNIAATTAVYSNGGVLVASAFLLTTAIFIGLSMYAMVTRRDFSTWGGMLMAGIIVVVGLWILNHFLQITALALAISGMAVLLASALILFRTQAIVRGGETNYVLAATGLFVDIAVLFNNLLHLLGFGFGED